MVAFMHSIVQSITPLLEENKPFFEVLHFLYLSEWVISRFVKLVKWIRRK